eukprot:2636086-Ditylum_brightwellii.AAC.1
MTDLIQSTYLFIAKQSELEGNFGKTEKHYGSAGDWLVAVNMYQTNDIWDKALQAAKFLGGADTSKQVAYTYALHLGINSRGPRTLSKMGLLDQAIEYTTKTGF